MGKCDKNFLGAFFWAAIAFKRYQNTSGCGTDCYYFHLPIGPFHCVKFEKILTADPEL